MSTISDFFRLAWGLLYWNARKTLYSLRGRRGSCPCQNPSDSGRAWETSCEAVIGWRSPEHFRRLCPLLKRDPKGRWRCSVSKKNVRPFWFSAVVFYAVASLALYLVGTAGGFVFLKSIGYRISYVSVVWPPAWRGIKVAKAQLLAERGQAALAARDIATARLAFVNAYAINPGNFQAGFSLAQLSQAIEPAASDLIYQRLLREHSGQAEQIAQSWLRALIARGDFTSIQALAAARLQVDATSAPWLHTFLFANVRTLNAEVLRDLISTPAVANGARNTAAILDLEADLRGADAATARRLLLRPAKNRIAGYYARYLCDRLIEHGFGDEALNLLNNPAVELEPRDRVTLQLAALSRLGWHVALRSSVDDLLRRGSEATTLEVLSTHLIRFPDPEISDALFARLRAAPPADIEANYTAYLAFFCSAAIARDAEQFQFALTHLRTISGTDLAAIENAGKTFLTTETPALAKVLPFLQPLNVEVFYAIHDRFRAVPVSLK